jgi:hypothetical protein
MGVNQFRGEGEEDPFECRKPRVVKRELNYGYEREGAQRA